MYMPKKSNLTAVQSGIVGAMVTLVVVGGLALVALFLLRRKRKTSSAGGTKLEKEFGKLGCWEWERGGGLDRNISSTALDSHLGYIYHL